MHITRCNGHSLNTFKLQGFNHLNGRGRNSLKSLIVVIPDINHISAVLKGLQNYFKIPG